MKTLLLFGLWLLCLGLVHAEPGAYLTVTGNVVNLRAEPSTSVPVVGKVKLGQGLVEVSRSGDWVEVKVPGGVKAWIHGNFVKAKLEANAEPKPATPTVARRRPPGNQLLHLVTEDNEAAADLLTGFLHQAGYQVEQRQVDSLVVLMDGSVFILEPKMTRDSLDRIVVAQLFGVKEPELNSADLRSFVAFLGEQFNIGKFSLTPEGDRLIFQSHITFVDQVSLREIEAFLDFLHEELSSLWRNLSDSGRFFN